MHATSIKEKLPYPNPVCGDLENSSKVTKYF